MSSTTGAPRICQIWSTARQPTRSRVKHRQQGLAVGRESAKREESWGRSRSRSRAPRHPPTCHSRCPLRQRNACGRNPLPVHLPSLFPRQPVTIRQNLSSTPGHFHTSFPFSILLIRSASLESPSWPMLLRLQSRTKSAGSSCNNFTPP